MHDRFYILFTFFSIRTSSTYANAVEYLSRFFGANETNCGEHPVITIIQRLHRTIANVEELKQHLVATNVSNNVNVHIFEHLKLQRQVSKCFKENVADICGQKCLWTRWSNSPCKKFRKFGLFRCGLWEIIFWSMHK